MKIKCLRFYHFLAFEVYKYFWTISLQSFECLICFHCQLTVSKEKCLSVEEQNARHEGMVTLQRSGCWKLQFLHLFFCDFRSNRSPFVYILLHLEKEDNSALQFFRAISGIFMEIFTLYAQEPKECGLWEFVCQRQHEHHFKWFEYYR